MGSIAGAVGADGGIRIPPLNAPVPTLRSNINWVITSIYNPNYQAGWTNTSGLLYVPFEYGWRAFTFQLVPGTATSASVTLAGTADAATAVSLSPQGAWETLPSASGAVFPNPILNATPPRLLYVNSGPWAAFRVTTGAGYPGAATGSYLLFGAAS
jgi:hypothetical protein